MKTITLSQLNNDIINNINPEFDSFFYNISSTEIRSIIYTLKSLVKNLDDFTREYIFKFKDVVVKANYNFKIDDFELTFDELN